MLSQPAYASFINTEAGLVRARGKTLMGWADIAGPGTRVPRGSVAEYWQPASGITAQEAVRKGMQVVMAPANHAYLDQKYVAGARGNAPPGLGQTWACPVGCDLNQAYDWDPGRLVAGVTDRNVIGVEGAVWSETLVDLASVDYMTFPRLMALAEVGWSAAHQAFPAQRCLRQLPAPGRGPGRQADGRRGQLLPVHRGGLAPGGGRRGADRRDAWPPGRPGGHGGRARPGPGRGHAPQFTGATAPPPGPA